MIAKIYKKICKLELVLCCVIFASIVALVLTAAVCRTISKPIQWSIDAAQLLFAWAAFLGADIAMRNKSLVGVGIFTRNLKPATQLKMRTGCSILIFIVLAVFVYYGFRLSIQSWKRAFQTLPLSYSWVTLSLPVSSIFMMCSTIHNIYTDFADAKEAGKS